MESRIELNINNKTIYYFSSTRIVKMSTEDGVVIECKVPNAWRLNRVFQFMERIILDPLKEIN